MGKSSNSIVGGFSSSDYSGALGDWVRIREWRFHGHVYAEFSWDFSWIFSWEYTRQLKIVMEHGPFADDYPCLCSVTRRS